MLQDRRQHQRVIPDQPLSVRCGESQCLLLCDLSEQGLAVDGFDLEHPAEVISLVFDLPDGRGHIQAGGEVAWANSSENRAGLRFVDLADASRQQLREWISASVFDTTELTMAEADAAQPLVLVTHETDSAGLLVPQAGANEVSTPYRTSPYLMLFALGVLSLFSGIVFARHYPSSAKIRQIGEIMAAGNVPETPRVGSISSFSRSPATIPSLPPTLPLNLPGLVLQVAAMQHEGNADALAKILQKRNFPAFVFQRGANAFYRVAVGVYGDPSSAVRVKDQLKAQGFQAILKHWSPA
jgi:hypothetical protein